MTRPPLVLKSLADLSILLDDPPASTAPEEAKLSVTGPVADAPASESEPSPEAAPDLALVLAQLEDACAVLAEARAKDEQARSAVLGLLERYDRAGIELEAAQAALARSRQVRDQATTLAACAFGDSARECAATVAERATGIEAVAARVVALRSLEVDELRTLPAVRRFLEERRSAEQARQQEAAEAVSARRLTGGLAAARAALAANHLEEAEATLGALGRDFPNDAELSSLTVIIARRRDAVKCDAAEAALRTARRGYRHAAGEAVALLERVDLGGLPQPLVRQVAGVWATACARLCRERDLESPLLRYLPAPALGVVVAREGVGGYYVVSTLGPCPWSPGEAAPDHLVHRARPLRAGRR